MIQTQPYIHPRREEEGAYAEMYDGAWRIHNGTEWVHSFDNESDAIKCCIKWGGIATGKAIYNASIGLNEYVQVKGWA